jgi:AcrR family transcriptional regulator
MTDLPRAVKNKHQTRTHSTKAKILDAAQAVFAEQGFEMTQLEEIAARAGYTRGAIYAHYSSKEDLFLALMDQRVHTKFAIVHKQIEDEPVVSKRLVIFKRWIASQVNDTSWGTLTLEFKLYALRRPKSRAKMQHLYELVSKSTTKGFIELLFGKKLSEASEAATKRRLAVMNAVLSAIVLESHFRPELLPSNQLEKVIDELSDALVHS